MFNSSVDRVSDELPGVWFNWFPETVDEEDMFPEGTMLSLAVSRSVW